ncbi:MAG: hypothetical protein Q8927_11270 [Bacteroidota bacterium]|nr:hypothetical protein [Bacteroidota bacterium]MDP4216772.1 hypothetical protein [Bacteroidota bacterium]MDP4246974.1 hypothetical protein [Bacteroidota bacterium]MDP4252648.1 hypothetical protein [Bacteroidota bacterium]MDP4258513.1 hypothetical protein [Bacteroidota bacterium]
MRLRGFMVGILLTATEFAFAQVPQDSSFFLLLNSHVSFSHANDLHINRWLARYGYPTESRVPASVNLELAAMPVGSNLLYSIKACTIVSDKNLSSLNLQAGLYYAVIRKRSFLLFAGLGAGYQADIITLNGDMPQDYKVLAAQYRRQLSLRRQGLFVDPSTRVLWYPVSIHQLQIGFDAGLGYDLDFNSRWRLGYYESSSGKYSHFRKIRKPSDQQRVSEFGLSYFAGLSLRLQLR